MDSDGDPLPSRAVARLGTARFRHDNGPWDVVYSPNGKFIASWIDTPGMIYVWDAETGKRLRRYHQPEHAVYPTIAFSADSKYFGGYQSVWDLKTGEEFLNLNGDFRAFSEGSPRVASLDFDKTQVWDLPNRKKLRDCPGQFLAFSKNGKRLTTQVQKEVVVWDVESGKEVVKIAGKFINHFAGQTVAVEAGEEIQLWDTAAGKKMARIPKVFDLEDHTCFPRHSFSGDGKKFAGLVFKDLFEKATIWDSATGKQLNQLVAPRKRVFLGFVWAPEGKTLATLNDGSGMTMSVYVWDAVTGKQFHDKIEGARLAFSPDGKRIASTDGIVIRTWDAATGAERTPVSGPTGGVLCVSFSADGGQVVAGYDNVDAATFRTWDVESRKVVRTFGPNPQRNLSGLKNKQAVFSPDGRSLFAVHWHRLLVLDALTGKADELEDKREQSLCWLAFGPDGKNVAALEMRQLNKSDLSFDRPKCAAVFRFLDGSSGRDLSEKDRPRWAASLQRLAPEPGPNTLSWSVSADFRLAAWVRLDDWEKGEAKDIRLREIATGKELPAVGFGGEVRALALSPDSRILAAITADRRLLFWDIAAGKEIASWPNPHSRHNCVVFRPGGKTIAVGCADSSILLYDVPGPPKSTPVAADDLDRLWTELASADTAVAYRGIARLRADPKSAVQLFQKRLVPVPNEAPTKVAALVADLDDPTYARREAASAAIANLGQDAVTALRSALANKPSPEHRERLEKALAKLTQQVAAPDDIRRLRALQVLEQIGDAASIDLLKKMGAGASEAWITQEAREAVSRLAKRR